MFICFVVFYPRLQVNNADRRRESFLPQKYHVNILGQILMTLLRHAAFPSGFSKFFTQTTTFWWWSCHSPTVRSNFHPTGPKYLDSKFEKLSKNNAPFLPQKLLSRFLDCNKLLALNIEDIILVKVWLAYASLGRHHGTAVPHETLIWSHHVCIPAKIQPLVARHSLMHGSSSRYFFHMTENSYRDSFFSQTAGGARIASPKWTSISNRK